MILYGNLFTLPDVTNFVTTTGEWSSALFDEFEPLIMMLIGVGIFILLINIVIRLFHR